VAGALFLWSLTLGALGSRIIPICVKLQARGKADAGVLEQGREVLEGVLTFGLPESGLRLGLDVRHSAGARVGGSEGLFALGFRDVPLLGQAGLIAAATR
jgi:hypothetical protein